MLKLIVLISIFAFVAFAEEAEEPHGRERRWSPFGFGFPWGGAGAYAGPGGAYAGPGGAYAGAAAGAGPWGYGPSPWFQPRSFFPFNWAPFPFFPWPQNWYEGENVCKEVRTRNDDTPNEFDEWLNKEEDASTFSSDYSHEAEQCKGSNTKFVCIKRIVENGKSRVQATKYECCHGFVRKPDGSPGCVESVPQPPPRPPQVPPQANAQPNDKNYYNIAPNQKYAQKSFSSSSSNSFANSVGKVPPQ